MGTFEAFVAVFLSLLITVLLGVVYLVKAPMVTTKAKTVPQKTHSSDSEKHSVNEYIPLPSPPDDIESDLEERQHDSDTSVEEGYPSEVHGVAEASDARRYLSTWVEGCDDFSQHTLNLERPDALRLFVERRQHEDSVDHSVAIVLQEAIRDVTPSWKPAYKDQSNLQNLIFGTDRQHQTPLIVDEHSVFDATFATKALLTVNHLMKLNAMIPKKPDDTQLSRGLRIADVCSGLGGNTWQFIHHAGDHPGHIQQIDAIDADEIRVTGLTHNLSTLMAEDERFTKEEGTDTMTYRVGEPTNSESTLTVSIIHATAQTWANRVKAAGGSYDWLYMSPPWGGTEYLSIFPWWGFDPSKLHPEETARVRDTQFKSNPRDGGAALDYMDLSDAIRSMAGISRNYMFFLPKTSNLREIIWTCQRVLKASLVHVGAFCRSMGTSKAFYTNYLVTFLDCPLNDTHIKTPLPEWTLPPCALDDSTKRMMQLSTRSSFTKTMFNYWTEDLHHTFGWKPSKTYHKLVNRFRGYKKAQERGLRCFTGLHYTWTDEGQSVTTSQCISRCIVEALREPGTPLNAAHIHFIMTQLPIDTITTLLGWTFDIVSNVPMSTTTLHDLSEFIGCTSDAETLQQLQLIKYSKSSARTAGGVFYQLIKKGHLSVHKDWEKYKKELTRK